MCWSEFGLKTTVVLFVPPGICRDCRKSVLESSISRVVRITSTDMEEGAACATPLTDLESLSCKLGHVTLVWTIILQYTIVTSNLQVQFRLSRRKANNLFRL